MKKFRVLLWVLTLTLLASVIAGCGTNGENADNTANTTTTTTPVPDGNGNELTEPTVDNNNSDNQNTGYVTTKEMFTDKMAELLDR